MSDRYEEALRKIAYHPHCEYDHPSNGTGQYAIGVADGHRCAADIAREALGVERESVIATTSAGGTTKSVAVTPDEGSSK